MYIDSAMDGLLVGLALVTGKRCEHCTYKTVKARFERARERESERARVR